jgi:hypothetical protein
MKSADAVQLRSKFLSSLDLQSQFYRMFDSLPGISLFAKNRVFRLVCSKRLFFFNM